MMRKARWRTAAAAAATAAAAVLRWHSCQGAFQCATARVPLDYRQPLSQAISLAVIRHRATDPAHRLGSLFFNSGGPTEQIEPFLASYPQIPAELRARFDIVSFDPRGFGFSTAINCFPSQAAERNQPHVPRESNPSCPANNIDGASLLPE